MRYRIVPVVDAVNANADRTLPLCRVSGSSSGMLRRSNYHVYKYAFGRDDSKLSYEGSARYSTAGCSCAVAAVFPLKAAYIQEGLRDDLYKLDRLMKSSLVSMKYEASLAATCCCRFISNPEMLGPTFRINESTRWKC